ncbi:putative leucine-rich repeat domain superfamily [Helianthus annuus]|nr:putative leucine-rich repeat domain superfamily [Helianthus annuus]
MHTLTYYLPNFVVTSRPDPRILPLLLHKLLPSFFRLHQLTVLKLHNCVFQPPAMFKGFSWLIRLDFENVGINADVLLRLISNCPLLAAFTLIGDEKHLKGCWNSDYVELVEDLPHIEFLRMSSYPIQVLHIGPRLCLRLAKWVWGGGGGGVNWSMDPGRVDLKGFDLICVKTSFDQYGFGLKWAVLKKRVKCHFRP